MTKFKVIALSLGALFGLSLLIGPGTADRAYAAQDQRPAERALERPANAIPVQGRSVNSPSTRNCVEMEGTRLCTYEIEGFSVSDEGELIKRYVVGQDHGKAAAPGDEQRNRSTTTWTFADGATMLLEAEGFKTPTETGTPAYKGSQVCIAGTGRFEGATCVIDWAHEQQDNGLYVGPYNGWIAPKAAS